MKRLLLVLASVLLFWTVTTPSYAYVRCYGYPYYQCEHYHRYYHRVYYRPYYHHYYRPYYYARPVYAAPVVVIRP